MIIICITKSIASEADQPIILTTTSWDGRQTYTTPDARPILNVYLKTLLPAVHQHLSLKQASHVFAHLSKAYLNKQIPLGEYAALGHYFFHSLSKHHPHSALFAVSLTASELWFVSHQSSADLSASEQALALFVKQQGL